MRIDDFLLRKLAVAFSVAGIIGLVVWSGFGGAERVGLSEIGEKHLGKEVIARGEVEWVRFSKGALVFGLAQGNGKINVVVFSPSFEEMLAARAGNLVGVEGKIENYRGSLEIVAKEVVFID